MTHAAAPGIPADWAAVAWFITIGNALGVVAGLRLSRTMDHKGAAAQPLQMRPEVIRIRGYQRIARSLNIASMLGGMLYWGVDPWGARGLLPLWLTRSLFDQPVILLIYLYSWVSLGWLSAFSLESDDARERDLRRLRNMAMGLSLFSPIMLVFRVVQSVVADGGATAETVHALDDAGIAMVWVYCLLVHVTVMVSAQKMIQFTRSMGMASATAVAMVRRLRMFQVLLELCMIAFTSTCGIMVFSDAELSSPGRFLFPLFFHACSLWASLLALWLDTHLGTRVAQRALTIARVTIAHTRRCSSQGESGAGYQRARRASIVCDINPAGFDARRRTSIVMLAPAPAPNTASPLAPRRSS